MVRARWSLTALSVVLVACVPQPGPLAPGDGPLATRASRRAQASPLAVEPTRVDAPNKALDHGVPPAMKHTLAGTVRVPAKLVTDNGAGLLSNNGASIVSNNGSNLISDRGGGLVPLMKFVYGSASAYRVLQAPDQLPLEGARVEVVDGAGKPVTGPGGEPLTTVTDANGAYAFEQPLPSANLVVHVVLGGSAGQLVAIAPNADAARRVDVDLVSTLTSGYILDRYVATQADPVATLGRLPADVEGDTRLKAAAALASGKVPLPTALTTQNIVATLEALRQAEPAFDAQMDTVKRLLILAGQSDLGAGLRATEVDLGRVVNAIVAPSGDLLLATTRLPAGSTTEQLARIWRLTRDGRLVIAAADDDPFINAPGPTGQMAPAFLSFGLDGAGGVLAYTKTRIGRIESNGRVTPLADRPNEQVLMAIGADGLVSKIEKKASGTGSGQVTVQVVRTMPGASPRPGAASPAVTSGSKIALRADGQATVYDESASMRWTYDSSADTWASVPWSIGTRTLVMDAVGNGYALDTNRRTVAVTLPDGTMREIATVLPPEALLFPTAIAINSSDFEYSTPAVCAAPDGTFYLTDMKGRVYHLVDGRATHVAGVIGTVTGGDNANAVALQQPVALAALPNGDIVVADAGRKQLLRVASDRRISVFGGNAQEGLAKEGQSAKDAPMSGVVRLLVDGKGDLYALQQPMLNISTPTASGATQGSPFGIDMLIAPLQLVRIGQDGVAHIAAHIDGAGSMLNTAVMAGDVPHISTMFAGAKRLGASGLQSLDLGSFGFSFNPAIPAPVASGESGATPLALIAGDATGKLWFLQRPNILLACTPPNTPVEVLRDDRFAGLLSNTNQVCHGVADTQGRLYFGDPAKACLWRFDPRDSSFTNVAGRDGKIFAGTTPDDSLGSAIDAAFAPDGSLLVLDGLAKQVKRIPQDKL